MYELSSVTGWKTYLFVSLALIGGAFGLPIPEDLPLLYVGSNLNSGKFIPELMLLCCYLSIVLGDVILYFFGYFFGSKLENIKFLRKKMSSARVAKISHKLNKHAFVAIFLARHLFYMRTATFLTCGLIRMRFPKFLLYDALSALFSLPIIVAIGFYASDKLVILVDKIKLYQGYLGIIALIILGFYVFIKKPFKNT